MNKLFFLMLFLLFTTSGKSKAQMGGNEPYAFNADGKTRIYYLHFPENLPENAPLVFVLHGYGGSAKDAIEFSKMNAVADEGKFAVCYPQANLGSDGKNSWNVGYSNPGIDDVSYLSSLATYLQNKYQLSSKNTFCTGMSNGADMCYQLACKKPDVFSAVAPVAGCLMKWLFETCKSNFPIPVFEIHGTNDSITFWNGDANYPAVGMNGYLSVPETYDFWVRKNNCTQTKIDTLKNVNGTDGSFVVRKKQTGGVRGNQVWLFTLVGGKHDWPGTYGNMDIVASKEIWNFFKLFVGETK